MTTATKPTKKKAGTAPDFKAIPAARRTQADALIAPPGDHSFGNGLMLRVESRGNSRNWFTKPTCVDATGIKTRRPFTIGRLDHIDLEAARAEAMKIHRWADGGLDVKRELEREKQSAVAMPTFGQHAELFIERHTANLKNESNRDGWRSSIANHVKPRPIWGLPIDEITVKDVLDVLDPIWKRIPVMASDVRSRIEMIIADAANRYSITRFQNFNPAQWTKGMRDSLGGNPPASGTTRGAQGSVPYTKIPALMTELRQRNTQTARAIYAITLSCLRWQEFIQMQIDELDLDAAQPVWTVPYARFKVDPHKQDYQVPLAPQLVAILREQIAELEDIYGKGNFSHIWPASVQGTRGTRAAKFPHMSSATMLSYLQRSMGYPDATIHGFRASFDTWADDQFIDGTRSPKYHDHAVEFCLAHVAPGGKTKKAYRRGMMFEARIGIMNDWANYCVPPATAKATRA
jgi:integrase